MKRSAVQAYVAAQILNNATLAAFGTPILASLESDEATVKELIDTRLRSPGACIEIGEPGEAEYTTLHPGGLLSGFTEIEVFIAENIASPTHTPRGAVLADLVTSAVALGKHTPSKSTGTPFVSENGYALTVLSFSIPVTVTK